MAVQNPDLATATFNLSQKLNQMIAGGSLNYNSWRSLILEIETTSQNDIDTISLSYDSFLSKFPLCHWHLEKYAYHKAKLYGAQEAIKIYERGAGVAMFSVGFWVDYFTFGSTCFGDPEDVRRLFGRAISYVGKDYFCHVLWDKYMNYEFSRQGWKFLAQSYIQALRFPTKKLRFYYGNFKQFVANLEEEMGYEKNHRAEVEELSVPFGAIKISRDEISLLIKEILDSSDKSLKCKALDGYRSIGEEYYQEACQLDEKIKCFETNIRRRFFCVTPLDDNQLTNWHCYLDFIEKQENLDWAVKLYERCLIPCANYPEFWMRYVDFLESRKGRELAISALERATQIFLKSVPEIHLFSARFKEHIGDVNGARASLLQCDTNTDSIFFEKVVAQAGLERRLGNLTAASTAFEEALKTATEKQKIHILPRLYSHFAQLTFMITGSASAARDVLIDGIRQEPCCRFLFEELIKFALTHEGASHVSIVDSIIADAVSPGLDDHDGLNANDRESISCLFLEFVNHCGTVRDVRKARNRHMKLFPQSIRTGATCKHSTSGNHSLNVAGDHKGRYNPAVHDQPSQNQLSVLDHPIQLQDQKRVPELPVNCQMHPSQVMEKQSPQKDQNNNAKETAISLSNKNYALSNEDALWDDEPPHDLPCQSREDKPGPVDVSAKLANQSEWNGMSLCDSVHDFSCQSRVEKTGAMDFCVDLVNQSKEKALSMCESADELAKSSRTTEPVVASCGHSSLFDVHSELDLEPKQLKKPVSLDNTSLILKEKESQELLKESQELISMSCDEYENKVSDRHAAPEEPSRTDTDLIKIDRVVTTPGHANSGLHEQGQEEHQLQQSFSHQQHHPSNELDSKMLMDQSNAQDNLTKHNLSRALGPSNDHAWSLNTTTPPSIVSAGQIPLSSQLASHPQQNMQQTTSLGSQLPGQAHQSLAMNQLLQYHYHQQHFMQQHYQHLHIQQPFLQLQQYQLQPQQQNQQHVLVPQQYYVQNQQLQSLPFQLQQEITSYQQSQQQLQQHQTQQGQQIVGHQQLQQGQQSNQLQELAYHVHQQGYQQHSAQGQQLLLPQYQLYQQGYQNLQQQQSLEWHLHSQEHLHQRADQKQQDEQLQKQPQQGLSEQSLTQNMSQNPQGPKNSPLEYDDSGKSSETPHLQGQSLHVLQ